VLLPGRDHGEAPVSLADWLDRMNSACAAAGYEPRCLNLDINYNPKNGPHNNCTVVKASPMKGTKVTTGRLVTLDVTCERPE
jgi:hypothetical protein